MSLSNLVTTFRDQAAANDGNITINAATFTDSQLTPPEGLNALLTIGYQLAEDTFLLVDTSGTSIPDPAENTLIIQNATAAVLNVDKTNTEVTLAITANDSGDVEFTIQIELSDWTFKTSWKYMTGGVFDGIPYTSPAFIFSTKEIAEYSWQKNNIALTTGQNFASLITLSEWLAETTKFLTSWSISTKIPLYGTIDPSKVNNETYLFPDMDILAPIGVDPISLLFLEVSNPAIGFVIESVVEKDNPENNLLQSNASDPSDDEPDETVVQTPFLFFQLKLHLGDKIPLDFRASIAPGSSFFMISVASEPDSAVTPLDLFSLMAGNNWYENIPPVLQQYLSAIGFKGFIAAINLSDGVQFNSVSTTVGSTKPWVLFNNFSIEEFDVNWLITEPETINAQTLFFTSRVNFFPTIFKGGFDVEITSDLTLSAAFDGTVSINDLLTAVTGGFIKIPESLVSIVFTGFGINMDINSKYYAFFATGDIAINIITNISLTDASLQLTSTSPVDGKGSNVYTAAISGLFTIGDLMLQSAVNYNSSTEDGGWDLSIHMPAGSKLDLGQLMDGLFKKVGFELPTSFLPADLAITSFDLTADIPNGKEKGSYEVKTSIEWKFTFPIINQKIDISAALALKYDAKKAEGKQYSGGVMGSILLEYFNAQVNIGYNFDGDDQLLMIEWEGFVATYDVSGESKVITFEIKNWSVGSLLTSFMKMLFDPNFELDAPWDVLNKISLDGFKVTYDLENKDVTVNYKLPKSLDLVFITIDGIKLTKNAQGVQISFTGDSVVPEVKNSGLFDEKGRDVKDMPEVPGQGNQYFDLRLLAMGQHVQLENVAQYQTIKEVTDKMGEAFETPENGKVPIGPGSGNSLLSFNENSNWLIATDFGILNAGTKEKPVWTLEMQAVFNDPNLYGLRIAMAGDKAKIFAGLDFEIMYKKISDGVGVYQIALTLPDALRYLQFGSVNITLPSIALAIYTNGDFMVDIGFPYNLDFSRSFTIQAIVPPGIPAMGSGGFYFGKLSSTTTKKVPQTNYGNFNPVIVFGIGMQVGIGYSVNYGVLKAGFSITIFGILEGVIATYHPYQGALQENNKTEVATSYYYWLQGTLGLIGKLYGSLDFGIISATVNITVKVYAQATLEAYNKMPLAIVASVDIKVSAKLNLGLFSIKINFSFKAEIRTDLTIGTDQTSMAPWNRQLQSSFSEKSLIYAAKSSQLTVLPIKAMHYNTKLVANKKEELPTLNIYFIPHLTVAGPENGNLKDQTAQYVTTLWIDAPDAENPDSSTISSFEYLSQDFFRWLIQNYVDETGTESTRATADESAVSIDDLQVLLALLSNEENPLPIPTDKLLAFLQYTFKKVNIQNVTEASKLDTAAVFPMFFDLELSVPDAGVDIDFSNYNMATDKYLSEVKKWFAQLAVKVSEENNNVSMKKSAAVVEHSLSTFVFEDYFVLIGKQLIGYAEDALKNYTYPLAKGNSLHAMTEWANSISTADGVTNTVSITDLAKANQSHPLQSETPIHITGVMYTVLDKDDFISIGAKYALETALLITQNAVVPGLLQVQEITFGSNTYTVKATDTITDVATGLQTTVSDLANNKDFQQKTLLTIDAVLIIAATDYIAKSEDTFSSIASTVYNNISVSDLLLQNQSVPGLFISGNSFVYDTTTYEIVPGDTLVGIAKKLSTSTNPVTVNDLANDTTVQRLQVQPLGSLLIQPFIYITSAFDNPDDADTLGKIAQKYSTTAQTLGANYSNQQQDVLFYALGNHSTTNIPGLKCLDVQSILDYFKANQSYTQLSGMVSRYQLHGMRLPTTLPGLTLHPDSPCTGDDCALYRLTGQQFEIPADVKEGFTINLINTTLDWLEFNGQPPSPVDPKKPDGPKKATLGVILTKEDISQISTVIDYAQKTGIQPDILKLSQMTPYNLIPVQYTFQTVTQWSTSGVVKLPYGNQGDQADVSPLIWNFPSGLLQQIALPKQAGSAFDIQIGTYNAAKGVMDYKKSDYYGWSTLLEIDIKKQSNDNAEGTNPFTYELIGANESGTQILERLLRQLDPNSSNNNRGIIEDIQWLYEGSDGLLSVGNINMKTFIVQSNLSTETNPAQSSAAFMKMAVESPEPNGVLNTLYDFIKFLWECSITRSGGYYLLYNETEGDSGFPDAVFDSSDNAKISLLVTYSNSYDDILKDFMNCAITGDKIDTSSSIVYAESKAQKDLSYTTTSPNETLQSIAAQYNILISELAILNETEVQLNTSSDPIVLKGLQYEVGLPTDTPSNTLTAISTYFGITEDSIKGANPDITNWDDLPVWQLLEIPEVIYQITTGDGTPGNTMKSIASYYFTDVDTLSFMIKDSTVFATGTAFSIVDQVVHKVSSIQQGSAGFELKRTNPGTPSDKSSDPGYANTYLNNLYNLLNYQVIANRYFKKSIVGLPSGPVNTDEQDETNPEQPWNYNQVIPIAPYAIDNPNMSYPTGYPQKDGNPYRGIGNTLQVHFDWVDYYGNETVTPFSNPELNTKSPLNNPPIKVGYLDELKGFSQWPSLFTTYDVKLESGNDPSLLLNFSFDISRYQNTDGKPCVSDPNDSDAPDYQKNALHDLAIYTNIYYQINQYSPYEKNKNTVTLTLNTSLVPGVENNVSLDPINTFVKDIYSYLYAIAYCHTIPTAPKMKPITQTIGASDLETASIFELTVILNMVRDLSFVNDDFKDSSSVTSARTTIQPNTYIPDGGKKNSAGEEIQKHSLTEFAVNFEKTFYQENEYVLKIATGVDDVLAGSQNSQAIYVVRMGLKPDNGIYWNVEPSGSYELTNNSIAKLTSSGVPTIITDKIKTLIGTIYSSRISFDTALLELLNEEEFKTYQVRIYTYSLLNAAFYAPLPISTSLASKKDVPLCDYVTGKGLDCENGTVKNFTGIDMDIWGKQCLDAIDLFLSSEFAVPGFLVDQLKSEEEKTFLQQQGIDADSFLEAITEAKSSLAETISTRVAPILTAPEVNPSGTLSAQEKFKQQLLIQLGNTYSINAVVQMQVTTASGIKREYKDQIAPRLYGTPGITDSTKKDSKLYSISNAKIQLDFDEGQKTSDLSFIFSTKNAKEFSTVSLDMDYQITHIEFDITDVPDVKGYQASQWLTFIVPINLADTVEPDFDNSPLQQPLGTVDIPIVLRNYPKPPTLTTQEGLAVSVSGDTTKEILEKASEWNFTYTYSEDQAAQDQIYSDITFNTFDSQQNMVMGKSSSRNLFNDMAQMISVWIPVLNDMTKYLTLISPTSDENDTNLNNAFFAMQAMVQLTNNLALAWDQHNKNTAFFKSQQNTISSYDFIIQQKEDPHFTTTCPCEGDEECKRLVVTIVPPKEMPELDKQLFMNELSIQEAEIPNTPVINIKDYTREPATDESGTHIENSYWYVKDPKAKTKEYLGYPCSFEIPDRTVAVDGLNVLQFQNTWAGIAVIRNEGLVEDNPTNTNFIYRTPLVRFSNKLIPLLSNSSEINIAKIINEDGSTLTLADHLATFFKTFFTYDELAEQTIKISGSWNYFLQDICESSLPPIQLPVLLYTPFSFEIPKDYEIPEGGCVGEITADTAFVCQLAEALEKWYQEKMPSTRDAYFSFDLSVFSAVTETQLPLIQLSNLVLPYKNIKGL
ncbi:LysM peptidoglycan-binding domain-containing protein [Aquimarina sp. MMG016]|uniref:LysM peptidoglycan-binding domain-containing protein n=1 Tax=Aquimarina sp. MMG016 TaxID=2822690 RepID=UPI001B39ED21|nr:LysM peptidoglycan-binding domain-containing protein [Aquimarina sp. MMG016]MBQ4819260.1 LysM peptidoglycan-binding domain-containing protein [Aquimarina sp. MMG016]